MEKIWNLGNLIPKLYPNPKIKSQDAASRRKRPDGRTRRSHAPKHVASRHHKAAETRHFYSQMPRAFSRGILWSVHLGVSFWNLNLDSLSWDLDITWEASYLDPKSLLKRISSLHSPSLAFILILQVFRVV